MSNTLSKKKYTVQVKFRLAIPDNIKYWQVFEGDKQIEDFLQSRNQFEVPNLDSKYEEYYPTKEHTYKEEPPHTANIDLLTKEHTHKIELCTNLEKEDFEVLQSNIDNLPKGLVPLEEMFDFNDLAKKP